MSGIITEYPQFFTASIKGRYKLLEHDKYKDIVINSLRFLAEDKCIRLFAFVMSLGGLHSQPCAKRDLLFLKSYSLSFFPCFLFCLIIQQVFNYIVNLG